MSVKLFLKHLFESIRRRPAQPIILVLVLALATALCITGFNANRYTNEESLTRLSEQFGNADLYVELGASSPTRFLFTEDVRTYLDDEDEVCGIYTLPVFIDGTDFVYGIASDYQEISDMFEFPFTETKPLYKSDVKDSIFISSALAEKYNVSSGDKLSLSILGVNKDFTVYGIAKYPFLSNSDILMDISAAVDTLSSGSLFLSMIEDEFIPSSKVFIKCSGDINETIDRITGGIAHINVTKAGDYVSPNIAVRFIVLLIVSITIFFAFTIIYCCFAVISRQRKEENDLFYAAGARGNMLNLLSMFEMFIYWLLGSAIGIGLSFPVSDLYVALSQFVYVETSITVAAVLPSLGILLAASQGSLIICMLLDKRKKKNNKITSQSNDKVMIIVLLTLIAAAIAIGLGSVFGAFEAKPALGMIEYFVALVGGYLASRLLYFALAKKLSLKENFSVTRSYALKNSYRVPSNANATSVFMVLFTILLTMSLVIAYAYVDIDELKDTVRGDYLVENVSVNSYETVKNTEGVDETYQLFLVYGNFEYKGKTQRLEMLSASSPEAYDSRLGIDRMPEGNEAFMPVPVAEKFHINLGDEIVLNYSGKEYHFVITEFFTYNSFVIIVNQEYTELPYGFVSVLKEDGYDTSQLYKNLTDALAFDNAVIVDKSVYADTMIKESVPLVACADFTTIFIVIFAIVGILDSIISSYISRKEEFDNYIASGMCRKDVRKMISSEVGFMLLVSFMIFILFFIFEFVAFYEMLYGFICDFFAPF
ncbi:MAG: hypothetical protein MJ068_03960 [Clostridia bacterium]|nr:hypothetical protein [Clostridia bacterium]